jgi:hypothetical protein
MNKYEYYERLSVLSNEIFESMGDLSVTTIKVLEDEFKRIYNGGYEE